MNTWAPPDLAEAWDNVGLQFGSLESEIQSILITLEISKPVLDHLKKQTYDLVITHHPVFFSPIKSLRESSEITAITQHFLSQKIALFCAHTNLDRAVDGVNDCFIKQFKLDPSKGTPFPNGFGKFFAFDTPKHSAEFMTGKKGQYVGAPLKKQISRIAFCAGSGKSLTKDLHTHDIDLFVTGEFGYHDHIFCEFHDITTFICGHKTSEDFILPKIKEKLLTLSSNLHIHCLI